MYIKMAEMLELQSILAKIKSASLNIKAAYKMSKLLKQVETEAEFFQTKLQAIIEEYGRKDDEGQYILTEDNTGVQIQEDKLIECQEKVVELNNLEVEFSDIKFTLDELENIDLSIEEIGILMPFIEE